MVFKKNPYHFASEISDLSIAMMYKTCGDGFVYLMALDCFAKVGAPEGLKVPKGPSNDRRTQGSVSMKING